MAERSSFPCAQRGVALITAMLVVALAATTAAYLALDQQIWIRQTQNLSDRAQAEVVRAAALEWAVALLVKDARDNNSDHLKEDWAQPLPPIDVEGGQILGKIEDAQGRFNLNNLVQGGALNPPSAALFRQLLQSLELNPDLVDAVIDWIDADANARPAGAEDIDYLQLKTPYRTANQALHSVEELRLVRGFTPEIVDKLRPWVTALPQATEINVNTAPKEVLQALYYTLDANAIDNFMAQAPFTDPGKINTALQQAAGGKALPPNLPSVGVQSSYFEVTIETQFGRYRRTAQALVRRAPGGQGSRALWHSQRLPFALGGEKPGAGETTDGAAGENI